MPVTPQSYLSPQSQPWGRYIEQSIANLEKGISINGQNSNNNLRQLNSSVQLLSQQQTDLASQQAYLNGLTTYSSWDTSTVSTTATTETLIKSISVTFTLARSYTVWVQATASGYCAVDNIPLSGAVVGGYARTRLVVDSSDIVYGGYRGTAIGPPGQMSNYWYEDVNMDHIRTFSAGTHTITAEWYGFKKTYNNGYVQILPAVLIASVIN